MFANRFPQDHFAPKMPVFILSGIPKEIGVSTGNSEGCAREAGLFVGASPTRRVGLFTAEHDLNSVAARRGWKLRKMNRRAVTKVNHI
jgi:hypothetical protein